MSSQRNLGTSTRTATTSAARTGAPAPSSALAAGSPGSTTDPAPPSEVVVRVLGPVDVVGAARPFARAWALDLVVYLALHPEGASSDAWPAALWPDRLVAEPTRHSTVSAARRALGRDAAGGDHLPHGRGRLRLGPLVTSDWARFEELSGATGPAAPGAWRSALELVRGRPFEGLRAADWPVLEGIDAHVQDAVVQLALRLADHLLACGDGRGAELAVRRGLVASPYDERLYRLLLAAADHQGNPGGVEAAMDELIVAVAGGPVSRRRGARLDPEALAWVHPDTVAAYRAFSRRRVSGRRSLLQPA